MERWPGVSFDLPPDPFLAEKRQHRFLLRASGCYTLTVSGSYTETEAETIRAFVRARQSRKRRELAARLDAARRDFDAIVSAIAREYRPLRV